MADTGWLDFGTVANISDIFTDWTNPSDAQSENAVYASNLMDASDPSNSLHGDNLTLSIPGGSVIDGIEVRFKGYGDGTYVEIFILDLQLNGGPSGDVKGETDTLPGSNGWSAVYGGPADMWSSGFDYDDITDPEFGVELLLLNSDSGGQQTGYIDTMQIKIYYTEGIDHYPLPPHFIIP